jgi:F0F1-type ATP synthase membrane subunit b/b'
MTDALLKKPDHIISLASSSMLVDTRVTVWTGTKQDSEISDEVTAAKKADPESGRFVKHLLANCPEHKRCMNYRQIVYNWMQKRTYDWAGSTRILPIVDYPKFMKEYEQHEAKFHELVDEFVKAYPIIVSNRAFTMGDMFRKEDYPTAEEVRDKFTINLYRAEVPTGDFRCNITSDLADDLSTHYERQAKQLVEGILVQQKEQLVEIMKTLAENCAVETVSENGVLKVKRKKLYESTLTRAQELCETFRSFNLTADSELEQMRDEFARVVSNVTIDKLRDNDAARVVVQEEVTDILSKFGL